MHTTIFTHPLKNSEELKKLTGSVWPSLSSSNDQPLPCTATSASVQSPIPARMKWNNQKKCIVSLTGHKPKWFSPVWETKWFLRSQWPRARNWPFSTVWKVKVIKMVKNYNQIKVNQMVALINGLVPNFFFADWAAGFLCWVLSAQRSPTWWSNPSPAEGASPPYSCL